MTEKEFDPLKLAEIETKKALSFCSCSCGDPKIIVQRHSTQRFCRCKCANCGKTGPWCLGEHAAANFWRALDRYKEDEMVDDPETCGDIAESMNMNSLLGHCIFLSSNLLASVSRVMQGGGGSLFDLRHALAEMAVWLPVFKAAYADDEEWEKHLRPLIRKRHAFANSMSDYCSLEELEKFYYE